MAITNTTSSKNNTATPAKKNNNKQSGAAKTAAVPVADPYGALRLLVSADDVALIQPASGRGSPTDVDTLAVDLPTGTVTRAPRPALGDDAADVPAVVGLLRLRGGAALAVVTRGEQVATLDSEPVFRITRTAVITAGMRVVSDGQGGDLAISRVEARPAARPPAGPSSPASDGAPVDDAQLLAYLRAALNPSGAGRGLFFSHGTHLTLNTQRREELARSVAAGEAAPMSAARSADRRFLWNRALAQPFLDAGADQFVPTVMMGSVGVIENVVLKAVDGAETGASPKPPSLREPGSDRSVTVDVQLIARRAVGRIGTRYWRRGADSDSSNVANFVETEQVVTARWATPASPPQTVFVASLVQVRGNMPMVWTQIPDGAFKPPFVLLDGAGTRRAFDEHAKSLRESYVYMPTDAQTTLVNLVKQTGDEGALEAEYGRQAARYNAEHSKPAAAGGAPNPLPAPLHYVPFDFHNECKTDDAYASGLAKLWALIADDFERAGMWTRLTSPVTGARSRQVGVIRTNCIDCLDRTNVGQSLVGRKALARALALAGGISGEAAADLGAGPAFPPALEQRFRDLWADHGDAISRQYAGTGALKSDVTRHGERTIAGWLSDGAKSSLRYLYNNFGDGHKQDALDLATGAFVPLKGVAPARFSGSAARASGATGAAQLLPVIAVLAATVALGGGASSSASGGGAAAAAVTAAFSKLASLDDFWKTLLVVLAVVAALVLLLLLLAPYLVDVPKLCPELADTVAVGVARGDGVARDLSGVVGAPVVMRKAAVAGKTAAEARRAKAE